MHWETLGILDWVQGTLERIQGILERKEILGRVEGILDWEGNQEEVEEVLQGNPEESLKNLLEKLYAV